MSRVFISYRRQDSSDVTGRIYDRLVARFGKEQVFKDVDNIPYGTDFRSEMGKAVGQSVVVLVVIGEHWLGAADPNGRRRIDNLDDFVRIEVEAALKRDVRVVPLLVGNATMPSQAELPEAIQALAFRNAVPVRNDPDFHRDMDRLIESIGGLVAQGTEPASGVETPAPEPTASAPARLMRFGVDEIEAQMRRRMCGQELAVAGVMRSIKLMRYGLFRDNKPAATFLFIGPSGVGKTLLARELARVVCGDEDRLVAFEMAQYRDRSAAARLVGAPQGYVGYGEGRLVNALRDTPECVLFFDGINKGDDHPIAYVMRLMDTGSIQDAAGPIRDARRAVLILSVSAEVDAAKAEALRGDRNSLAGAVRGEARRHLPAEVVNRVDEVVCFLPFSKDACREITDTWVEREVVRFRDARGMELRVDESVKAFVAEVFYEASLTEGARAAPRVVQRLLTGAVVDYLVGLESGASPPGAGSSLAAVCEGGQVRVSVSPPTPVNADKQ